MKGKIFEKNVKIPEGVTITQDKRLITVKGKNGECKKLHFEPKLVMKIENDKVTLTIKGGSKRNKTTMGTIVSHIENMIKGVTEGHTYQVKICSGHFPMKVAFNNNMLSVKNFLGEKIPREIKTLQEVDVKIDGDIITIKSCDKEFAGQTAANFERLTRITNRDRRIFQDGLYIIAKSKK